jgi:hypothetical protein
MEAPWS